LPGGAAVGYVVSLPSLARFSDAQIDKVLKEVYEQFPLPE
jgi:hypothetical protein